MFTKFYKLFGKQHENEKFQLKKLKFKRFLQIIVTKSGFSGLSKMYTICMCSQQTLFFYSYKTYLTTYQNDVFLKELIGEDYEFCL